MKSDTLIQKIKTQLQQQWIACRAVSDKRSVQYGIRFSYPIYITLVFLGTLFANPYLLIITTFIALFGSILPLHPFDYLYNYGISKLIGIKPIPGRGSELQVNSIVAVIFNIVVMGLVVLNISISYPVLSIIYVLLSMFFLSTFLFKR